MKPPWMTLHFRAELAATTCEKCRCKVSIAKLGAGQPSVLLDVLAVELLGGEERTDLAIHDCRRTLKAREKARELVSLVLDAGEAREGKGGGHCP